MGCSYPVCMSGGGGCPYTSDCDSRDKEEAKITEEKRLLDLEEQKARIEYYRAKTKALSDPKGA